MKFAIAAAPQVAPPQRTVAVSGLLQRQCMCGSRAGSSGECEGCSKKRIVGLQTKMQVGLPGDAFEQEADRVADQVMTMSSARKGQDMEERSATPLVQRRVSNGAGGLSEAPSIVDDVLHSPGQQLDAATRAFFEPRFGYDFSRVRVHADLGATESARAVNASAYTVGQHVVFESSQFDPGSHGGRTLLAHELAHVIQQSKPRGSSATSVLEAEAKVVSARASESHQVSISGVVPQGVLQRQEAEDEGGSVQVIAKENGLIAVVLVRNGKIVQGYTEITPPPGVSAADAVKNDLVKAYVTEVTARPNVDVVLPKNWARRQPVNLAAKVQIKDEEQVAREAENIRKAGERTEKVNQLRELYRAYLRDKTWDDCGDRGFCSAYGMSDDDILAVEEDDMSFKEWMQFRQSEAAKHQVERENEYYRRQIDPTGELGFSGKDAREIIESNGPLDATPWERKHQFSGSLPNAIREDQTGLVTGYVLTEYRQVRLAGGVGEVIQIVVDRDGNEVERTSTTVLTPETEFVQDAARGLPVSSHVINFLEASAGVSLDVRDPGRQLNEGEAIDRAINTIPFADTVRTAEEVFSGVDLSDRGIQAQLEGDALILPEKVRIGKGILLGVEALTTLIGAKVKVNPKIHPKGAKLRPNSAHSKPLPARRPPNKLVQKGKSPVAEKGFTTEKATVGPDAPKPKAVVKQVDKDTTLAVKDTGEKASKVLDVTAEAVPVPKKSAAAQPRPVRPGEFENPSVANDNVIPPSHPAAAAVPESPSLKATGTDNVVVATRPRPRGVESPLSEPITNVKQTSTKPLAMTATTPKTATPKTTSALPKRSAPPAVNAPKPLPARRPRNEFVQKDKSPVGKRDPPSEKSTEAEIRRQRVEEQAASTAKDKERLSREIKDKESLLDQIYKENRELNKRGKKLTGIDREFYEDSIKPDKRAKNPSDVEILEQLRANTKREINNSIDELGKLRVERAKLEVTPLARARAYSYSASSAKQVSARAGGLDEMSGRALKNASIDHVVPVDEIVLMDNWTKVPLADQQIILSRVDNLRSMEKSRNLSKGNRRWVNWKQGRAFYGEKVWNRMVAEEGKLRILIQQDINKAAGVSEASQGTKLRIEAPPEAEAPIAADLASSVSSADEAVSLEHLAEAEDALKTSVAKKKKYLPDR